MTYPLDTNICIAYLGGKSPAVRARLQALSPQSLAVCAVVKAELLFGAIKSQRSEENLSRVQRFLDPLESFPFDDEAAVVYASIRHDLERSGTPIGPNDLIIAAIALSRGCTLVSANTREFGRVPDLMLENWL